jgi:hypothetical protein
VFTIEGFTFSLGGGFFKSVAETLAKMEERATGAFLEHYIRQAVAVWKKVYGPQHLGVAGSSNSTTEKAKGTSQTNDGGGGHNKDGDGDRRPKNSPVSPFSESEGSPNVSVQILIWDKEGGGDVGHVALKIGDTYYGYYPTDENGKKGYDMKDLFGSPGVMVIHTEKAFKDQYGGQGITSFDVNMTYTQMTSLEKGLRGYSSSPGKYSLNGNTCTSVAVNELIRVGVPVNISMLSPGSYMPASNGWRMSPSGLLSNLSQPYNAGSFSNKTWFKP